MEKAQRAARYVQVHGRFNKAGFEEEWEAYVEANPLFADMQEQWMGGAAGRMDSVPPPEGFVPD